MKFVPFIKFNYVINVDIYRASREICTGNSQVSSHLFFLLLFLFSFECCFILTKLCAIVM